MVRPWSRRLPLSWILVGALFPDLLDKSFHLILRIADGTRTLGHTAVLLVVLSSIAWIGKSKDFVALCLGIATHLVLDGLSELVLKGADTEMLTIFLWPALGWEFPVMHRSELSEFFLAFVNPFLIGSEILGLALLIWEYRAHNTQSQLDNL